jgi:hypothetical protein
VVVRPSGLEVVGFRYDSIEVRRGSTYEQVGEDRGSKETDGCPLTSSIKFLYVAQYALQRAEFNNSR